MNPDTARILAHAAIHRAVHRSFTHNLQPNSIVYPGTHDNDTTRGWYAKSNPTLQHHVRHYLRVSGEDIAWDFIRAAYGSCSRIVIVPIQDLLNLDSGARMNIPGCASGNWQWRFSHAQLDNLRIHSVPYLKELARMFHSRANPRKNRER